jgi:hypothetical protein
MIEAIAVALFLVFLYEHIGRTYSLSRPSTALTYVASWATWGFTRLGERAAWISSFYTRLELLDTLWALLLPLWDLVASPLCFCKGYITASLRYTYPALIVCGSVTLLGALTYALTAWLEIDLATRAWDLCEAYECTSCSAQRCGMMLPILGIVVPVIALLAAISTWSVQQPSVASSSAGATHGPPRSSRQRKS